MVTNRELSNRAMKDTELEKVSGGDLTFKDCYFSGYVGKYDGIVGQGYYIYDKVRWYYGTLLDTYERSQLFGLSSRRTHKFHLVSWEGNAIDTVQEFSGDDVDLYITMTRV